ncbi:sll0787 family AIR synthase-like protein [Cupriavidus sp. 30B13]|uniref:sll0787 family AIR synthase-like protein n=1 Tax=Cupriavidus sp. 30B13 TaxID=3384241 RepID=UPI003B8FC2A6
MTLDELVRAQRASRGFGHKTDIAGMLSSLGNALPGGARDLDQAVAVGDDCAAIADGDGYLLFAIEGMVSDFIRTMPWFAGYSAVMVNVSDVYAMGGRPLAVVDAIWSQGVDDAAEVFKGMAAAASRYGVPIVGGHSNARSDQAQLAVAILGRAGRLLSSFAARPGQRLLMAVDLRGAFVEPYPYWNASTEAPAGRLRGDLDILPALAEDGLCGAAKDISMAGTLGTALMLLECSGVGAGIDLARIPVPPGVDLQRWLTAFPSYGFLLAVDEQHVPAVGARFGARGIACADIGAIDATRTVRVERDGEQAVLWDFASDAFIVPRGAQPLTA